MNFKHPVFFITLSFLYSCSNDAKVKTIQDVKKDHVSKSFSPLVNRRGVESDPGAPKEVDLNSLPANIKYNGTFYKGTEWCDKSGKNLLVLSTSSLTIEDKDFGSPEYSGELFAKQFIVSDSAQPKLLWEMRDGQLKCLFDLTCNFITANVTDLDKDSISETFILYRLSCRSDASPAKMKLILHEGKQKYALRGLMILRASAFPDSLFPEAREIDLSKIPKDELFNTPYRDWGCFENANDFRTAPPSFFEYASSLWKENSNE